MFGIKCTFWQAEIKLYIYLKDDYYLQIKLLYCSANVGKKKIALVK